MSPPDRRVDPERLEALPPIPRDEEGPVFSEPWQAQAFALAVRLSEQGHFTWKGDFSAHNIKQLEHDVRALGKRKLDGSGRIKGIRIILFQRKG